MFREHECVLGLFLSPYFYLQFTKEPTSTAHFCATLYSHIIQHRLHVLCLCYGLWLHKIKIPPTSVHYWCPREITTSNPAGPRIGTKSEKEVHLALPYHRARRRGLHTLRREGSEATAYLN